jgi:hypothetical protein
MPRVLSYGFLLDESRTTKARSSAEKNPAASPEPWSSTSGGLAPFSSRWVRTAAARTSRAAAHLFSGQYGLVPLSDLGGVPLRRRRPRPPAARCFPRDLRLAVVSLGWSEIFDSRHRVLLLRTPAVGGAPGILGRRRCATPPATPRSPSRACSAAGRRRHSRSACRRGRDVHVEDEPTVIGERLPTGDDLPLQSGASILVEPCRDAR